MLLFHLFLLATFVWINIEIFSNYQLITDFISYEQFFVLKRALFGCGNFRSSAVYTEIPGTISASLTINVTSPQSNLRRARRSSADKTNSTLLGSHSPSMLTVRSRSC